MIRIETPKKYAQTITVAKIGGMYNDISTAITSAVSGDTIEVYPGTYTGKVTGKDGVNIIGIDKESCIIDNTANDDAALLPASNSLISNLTIKSKALSTSEDNRSATTATGSTVYFNGVSNVELSDCIIEGGNWSCGWAGDSESDIVVARNIMKSPNPINSGGVGVFATSPTRVFIIDNIWDWNGKAWKCHAWNDNGFVDSVIANNTGRSINTNTDEGNGLLYGLTITGKNCKFLNNSFSIVDKSRKAPKCIKVFGVEDAVADNERNIASGNTVDIQCEVAQVDSAHRIWYSIAGTPNDHIPPCEFNGNNLSVKYVSLLGTSTDMGLEVVHELDAQPAHNDVKLWIDRNSLDGKPLDREHFAITYLNTKPAGCYPRSQYFHNVSSIASHALLFDDLDVSLLYMLGIQTPAAQPDHPRCLTVVCAAESSGTLYVWGYRANGDLDCEIFTLGNGTTVVGNKAFKEVIGAWSPEGAAGSVDIKVNDKLGLMADISATTDVKGVSTNWAAPAAASAVSATYMTVTPTGSGGGGAIADNDDFLILYNSVE